MNPFGNDRVNVPTCEEVVGLALAQEGRASHEQEAKTIATLLILRQALKEIILGHYRTQGLNVAHALARDARALTNRLERLALNGAPEPKASHEHVTRALGNRRQEALHERQRVEGERGKHNLGARACALASPFTRLFCSLHVV